MTKELYLKSIYEAVGYLTQKIKDFPKIAVILGSGLGDYADTFRIKRLSHIHKFLIFQNQQFMVTQEILLLEKFMENVLLQCREEFIFMRDTQWMK